MEQVATELGLQKCGTGLTDCYRDSKSDFNFKVATELTKETPNLTSCNSVIGLQKSGTELMSCYRVSNTRS